MNDIGIIRRAPIERSPLKRAQKGHRPNSWVARLAELSDNVHAHGAKLGAQIFRPEYDSEAINALLESGEVDEVRTRLHHDMQSFVNEVAEDVLLQSIDKICACAVRARKAGVGVIQVQGDRLVGAFCSTKMNQQTDRFGGSLPNRIRFALLLVHALEKTVPEMVIDY